MTNKLTKYGFTIIAAVLVIAMAFAGAGAATGEYVKVWNGTALQSLTDGGIASGSSGTATLTGTPGTTDPCVLELNGFVIDASATSTAIIDANVPNLTIKLVGDSKLTGGYENSGSGLIYSSGNLTITTDNTGKLLVNNTVSSNGNAIFTPKDITIEKGTIDVTGSNVLIQARYGNITIGGGTVIATVRYSAFVAQNDITINNGTINAIATDNTSGKVINTYQGNVIINNGTVTATAGEYAIYASAGNVIITDGTVNATATGDNGYAIYAKNELTIEKGTVNATANYIAIYAYNGNITIAGAACVDARANSTSGNAYSIWAPNVGKQADKGIISITGNSVLKANATGSGDTYALYAGTCQFYEPNSCAGRIIIDETSEIEAIATSSTSSANPILAHNDILIGEGTVVNAIALSDGDWAYSIYSSAGNITISDANTVNAYTSIQNYTADSAGNSFAIYADGYIAVDSVAILNATSDALGDWHYSYAIYTGGGPVTIIDSPDVTIHAYSDKAFSYALTAASVEIDSSIVNVTVNTETNTNCVVAIEAWGNLGEGYVHISDSIVTATAAGYCPYGIVSWSDYVKIDGQSTVDVHAIGIPEDSFPYSEDYAVNTNGIWSALYIDIDSATSVNVTSEASAKGSDAFALYSKGNISITNSDLVKITAISTGAVGLSEDNPQAYSIYGCDDIIITDSTIAELNSTSSSGYASAIYDQSRNISISDSTIGEITGSSVSGYVDTLCGTSVSISSSEIGTMTAYSGDANSNLFWANQNIIISNSTIAELNSTSSSGDAYVMYTNSENGDILIANSTLSLLNSTSYSGDAYAIFSYWGDLIIGEGSILFVNATGVAGYAMVGGVNLTMTNPTLVSAIGTTTSFAYYTGRDIDSLELGYRIVNATYPETVIGFTAFRDDWNYDKQIWNESYYASNYTSVLIAKEVTVALDSNGGSGGSTSVNVTCGSYEADITNPGQDGYTFAGWFTQSTGGVQVIDTDGSFECGVSGYTDDEGMWVRAIDTTLYAHWTANPKKHSTSKDMGSTVILTETVTPTPVPTATPAATAVPTIATVKPTQQQTSKSPAPFIGLIAGLGAVAVLLRLRK